MYDIILKGFSRQEFNQIFFLLCRRKHFIDLVQVIHIDTVFIINMRFSTREMIVSEEQSFFGFLVGSRSVYLYR